MDARCRISYCAFFIQGLYDVFGRDRVRFSAKRSRGVSGDDPKADYERYMCILLESRAGRPFRISIDSHDGRWLSGHAFDWSDVYAKVNIDPATLPSMSHPKMVATSPNSGYKVWGDRETWMHFWLNMFRCGFKPLPGKSRFRKDYRYQFNRLPLEAYESVQSTEFPEDEGGPPYVYYVSTLWRQANCIEQTNPWRRLFMEVCKSSPCLFEGGFFASDPGHPQYGDYSHLRVERKYPLMDYFERMQRSVIAFNTPAVHNCHGWKLSEYLAMGKAILATPISIVLPKPLEHGRNVRIVANAEEMREGVTLLLTVRSYREKLSEGAREYCRAYATPAAAIRLILESPAFRSIT